MTACPIPFDRLVEYWASDAGDVADVEAHIFSCVTCAVEAERIAQIVTAFRGQLPPAISHAQLAELARQGLAIEQNSFQPGTRTPVTFGGTLDLLVHHLTGLDLAGAERVELTVRTESTGAVLHHDPFAPFDPVRGEILIACQRHFSLLPPDVVFDVEVHRGSAAAATVRYAIPHTFA